MTSFILAVSILQQLVAVHRYDRNVVRICLSLDRNMSNVRMHELTGIPRERIAELRELITGQPPRRHLAVTSERLELRHLIKRPGGAPTLPIVEKVNGVARPVSGDTTQVPGMYIRRPTHSVTNGAAATAKKSNGIGIGAAH